MRTLGVDLAAQDKDTAICAIVWASGGATVEVPIVGPDDTSVVTAMHDAHEVGIDAPFGWPGAMVDAVAGWTRGEPWPTDADSALLRHRETDRHVHAVVASEAGESVWPLSVSSDRIAVCAWRCARILTAYGARPADGVREVYPAAALAMWGLPHKGYKSSTAGRAEKARACREEILASIEGTATWLDLSDETRERCHGNDDAFDSFISALVARAAAVGLTHEVPADLHAAARREGWIELPRRGSLAELAA